MLLKSQGKPTIPEWGSSNFISPRLASNKLRSVGDNFTKERSNVDHLATSRGFSQAVIQLQPMPGATEE
jgi:hypothetical protein